MHHSRQSMRCKKLYLFGYTMVLSILITYAKSTCNEAFRLGVNFPPNERIPDSQITASSEQVYRYARYGRLHASARGRNFGVWCADTKDGNPWLQVDFKKMITVTQVATGSNDFVYAYTKTFTLKYSYNGRTWFDVYSKDTLIPKVFQGIQKVYVRNKVNLDTPVTARFFRVYPKTYFHHNCTQVEYYGCMPGKDCAIPVHISDRKIVKDSQFTASSSFEYHHPYDARINATVNVREGSWGAWCPEKSDKNPWLQVDLLKSKEISKIATEGHPVDIISSWMTSFTLQYSLNSDVWTEYDKVLVGNSGSNDIKYNKLINPVIARYVRIVPKTWYELACFRMELYQCLPKEVSIPKVVRKLDDVAINRGESLKLTCSFYGQPGIVMSWNMNGEFLATSRRIFINSTSSQLSATTTLVFKRLKSSENRVTFSCIGYYPGLDKVYAQSNILMEVKAPVATLTILNITATTVNINLGITGPRTKDIVGYVIKFKAKEKKFDLKIEKFNESMDFEYKQLKPYTNYTMQSAVLYLENEFGKFENSVEFMTLQDKPYGAPLNLEVTKVSHDVLLCEWEKPTRSLRNGPITNYEVRFFKAVKKGEKPQYKYKFLNNINLVHLRGLEAGASYEISVRAFTMIGGGPYLHPPILMFTGQATEELNAIKELEINEGNAAAVGNRLKNITANPNFLNKHDVELTIDILEKVVEVKNKSELLGESLVKAVSNVLKANKTVLEESEITNKTGTRYVKMLEKWLESVKPEEKKLEENSENVVVKKIFLNKLTLEEGIKFAEAAGNEMIIPKEALPANDSDESVFFVYYKTDKFFVEPVKIEELCIDGFTVMKKRQYTPVITGEVVGKQIQNLSDPVVLKIKTEEEANLKDSACVYWDFKADDSRGGWSTEGCKVESIVNKTITCHCNHLTNFAAMMDIYAHTSRACGVHQQILSYISIIGCFLSIVGLFLTFLTYFLFRRLLKELAAKVLVQLCFALFVVILTFVTGIERVDNRYICTTVAVVLHYFTLVVFMWMFMEAVFMYYAFVKVWPPREGGDIYKSTVVAWGIPLFIVLVTFLVRMDDYGSKHYCHVTGLPLYVAYLGPIAIIIIVNLVIFIFIMHRLSSRPNKTTDKSNFEVAMVRVKRAFGIMLLMGLTWAFGFGTATSARLEFSYLFSTCNALQGFAIFIFYCVAQKNARNAWYRFISCDNRTELKRNTDSYYERRRLSSTTSNKTSTLPFSRGYSNASSIYQNSRGNNSYTQISNAGDTSSIRNTPMNTIVEVESPKVPIKFQVESPVTQNSILVSDTVFSETDGMLVESAEDELLNARLQEAEEAKKKHDLKQYSSYRALSGSSYDVLNLTKAPSGKGLHKDNTGFLRKSCENIANKRRKSSDLRKSLVDPVTSDTSLIESLRTAKSMEHINKKQMRNIDIPETEVGLTMFNKVDSKGKIQHRKESLDNPNKQDASTDSARKTTITENSNEIQNVRNESFSNGTLKSDAATMTETLGIGDSNIMLPPLYHMKTQRSQEDIINWLHECDEKDSSEKHYDSDYSSSYYRTSRSSSVTDISSFATNSYRKSNHDKGFLDTTIMGPLKGHKQKKNKSNRLSSSNSNITMTNLSNESLVRKQTNYLSAEDVGTRYRSSSKDYIKFHDDGYSDYISHL